ncbi:hypothetical protein [Aureimonas endophytica]|nr:hypothetical protein [Aureimonas endophytica]
MNERERLLLRSLAWMVAQYLSREDMNDGRLVHCLDNMCMTAGEEAMALLADAGFVKMEEGGFRFGEWTAAGRELLDSD